ncbi:MULTISPECIES: hypothetical protein [Klebsiella]|uniref:hypothetical protein n=1 Tax=Klebsiella TaxID=570 RepID=UPI00097E42D8|nr:hypothetical protein [Klebsiella variicola]ELA0492290.1 hypothetical protein [Klebsiella variicola]MBA6168176.1 hypothetical protein [Klebsiella variicola]MCD9776810.1 hypothetical protein [Klebsiella variicola subsp. variicola]MCE0292682.1 hypothetical protein [Klebsiella variicola subsp. variicola]MCG5490329.1 hypothetical protein [Klebsiella variicola]
MTVSPYPADLLYRDVVGWHYAYPTYGSRHGELKISMPGVGSRLTRPVFGDLSILLKIPAIKRGFLALTRRVK